MTKITIEDVGYFIRYKRLVAERDMPPIQAPTSIPTGRRETLVTRTESNSPISANERHDPGQELGGIRC
jgi:hypothetical protein